MFFIVYKFVGSVNQPDIDNSYARNQQVNFQKPLQSFQSPRNVLESNQKIIETENEVKELFDDFDRVGGNENNQQLMFGKSAFLNGESKPVIAADDVSFPPDHDQPASSFQEEKSSFAIDSNHEIIDLTADIFSQTPDEFDAKTSETSASDDYKLQHDSKNQLNTYEIIDSTSHLSTNLPQQKEAIDLQNNQIIQKENRSRELITNDRTDPATKHDQALIIATSDSKNTKESINNDVVFVNEKIEQTEFSKNNNSAADVNKGFDQISFPIASEAADRNETDIDLKETAENMPENTLSIANHDRMNPDTSNNKASRVASVPKPDVFEKIATQSKDGVLIEANNDKSLNTMNVIDDAIITEKPFFGSTSLSNNYEKTNENNNADVKNSQDINEVRNGNHKNTGNFRTDTSKYETILNDLKIDDEINKQSFKPYSKSYNLPSTNGPDYAEDFEASRLKAEDTSSTEEKNSINKSQLSPSTGRGKNVFYKIKISSEQ